MVVRWLESALTDLANIEAYIARDKPRAARSFISEIRKRTRKLATFPHAGRAGRFFGVRELIVRQHYRVGYHIRGGRVEILFVHHTAQEWLEESVL